MIAQIPASYLTVGGLVVVRMPQDNTYHLADPQDVNVMHLDVKPAPQKGYPWHGTRTICRTSINAEVTVYHPGQVADVPVYRGRNEFSRCQQCDDIVRLRMRLADRT